MRNSTCRYLVLMLLLGGCVHFSCLAQSAVDEMEVSSPEVKRLIAQHTEERSKGQGTKALSTCKEAFAMTDKTTSPQDWLVCANHLADCECHYGELPEAEKLGREIVVFCLKRYGREAQVTEQSIDSLLYILSRAECLDELNPLLRPRAGHLGEMEPTLRHNLAIAEASPGKNELYLATCLSQLATLLNDIRPLRKGRANCVEAEALMRRALEICVKYESDTGKTHWRFHRNINDYAMIQLGLGNHTGAARSTTKKILEPLGDKWDYLMTWWNF